MTTSLEWQQLDPKCDTWAVRHFNKFAAPFDLTAKSHTVRSGEDFDSNEYGLEVNQNTGLIVQAMGDGVSINVFSDSATQIAKDAEHWKKFFTRNRSKLVDVTENANSVAIKFGRDDKDDGSNELAILMMLGYTVYV